MMDLTYAPVQPNFLMRSRLLLSYHRWGIPKSSGASETMRRARRNDFHAVDAEPGRPLLPHQRLYVYGVCRRCVRGFCACVTIAVLETCFTFRRGVRWKCVRLGAFPVGRCFVSGSDLSGDRSRRTLLCRTFRCLPFCPTHVVVAWPERSAPRDGTHASINRRAENQMASFVEILLTTPANRDPRLTHV